MLKWIDTDECQCSQTHWGMHMKGFINPERKYITSLHWTSPSVRFLPPLTKTLTRLMWNEYWNSWDKNEITQEPLKCYVHSIVSTFKKKEKKSLRCFTKFDAQPAWPGQLLGFSLMTDNCFLVGVISWRHLSQASREPPTQFPQWCRLGFFLGTLHCISLKP